MLKYRSSLATVKASNPFADTPEPDSAPALTFPSIQSHLFARINEHRFRFVLPGLALRTIEDNRPYLAPSNRFKIPVA